MNNFSSPVICFSQRQLDCMFILLRNLTAVEVVKLAMVASDSRRTFEGGRIMFEFFSNEQKILGGLTNPSKGKSLSGSLKREIFVMFWEKAATGHTLVNIQSSNSEFWVISAFNNCIKIKSFGLDNFLKG